jgi:hypothetical protein
MKKLLVPSLFFSLSIALSSFNSQNDYLTFEKAIADKKIEIKIIPNGSYSGNSIDLEVKNLTKGKLDLQLPVGTVFIPSDTNEQTLVVPGTEFLSVEKNESKILKVNAYCTEANDHCPSASSVFTMSKTDRPKLRKLVQHLDSIPNLDMGIIQQTIWCVTDNESVSDIYSENLQQAKDIRKYVCNLTSQIDTWYSTRKDVSVDAQHNIVSATEEIKGTLSFQTNEPIELQGYVKDNTGKIIVTNPNKTTGPAGKITFEFNMKVSGWKPGNYFVVYTNNGKEVINQPFTIEQ